MEKSTNPSAKQAVFISVTFCLAVQPGDHLNCSRVVVGEEQALALVQLLDSSHVLGAQADDSP